MGKSIFFGIWEFMFLIIILLIVAFFIWPSINRNFEIKRENAFLKVNEKIVNKLSVYVDSNPNKYKDENVLYKISLREMSELNIIETPIKNIITSKNYDLDNTFIKFEKKNNRYNYELVVIDTYKNSVYLKDMNVKVGDYVSYPNVYTNAKLDGIKTIEESGWRIIEINEKEIKIISTGATRIVSDNYDFFNVDNYKDEQVFGDYINTYYVNDKVSYLTNKEIAKIAVSSDLRTIGVPYYVFNSSSKEPMIVGYDGIIGSNIINVVGIRPILTLRRDLKTTGKIFNEWQLIPKEE